VAQLEETEGLRALVKEMNAKLEMYASAVLVADECRTVTDDLRNIIEGIGEEGRTLRILVTNIKASGAS
jgi:uncharacterized protein YfkK (UPF0435 family)